ncbi:hypothetical protein [Flavobacterium piscisymbiosum]|uniref:Uncharacterized protein n=1 Tax=Flavobacterium piscisymbiosum TaxID=2893753 RepID=A0ABS8MHC4_9FLAO|nr:hypothetical protein [Flavobacterium sp. F-30]MCC9064366.1 hypothetical protein [Flavobacterium sp. F-30]
MVRKIILRVLLFFLCLFVFMAWTLYLVEIEDHYGDLQEIYFDSKTGDIIINKQTEEFGIISKNWKRADVITKKNDTLDLYDIIYVNQKENKYEVFRSKKELKIEELSFEKIVTLKKDNSLRTIIKN